MKESIDTTITPILQHGYRYPGLKSYKRRDSDLLNKGLAKQDLNQDLLIRSAGGHFGLIKKVLRSPARHSCGRGRSKYEEGANYHFLRP